MALSSLNRYRLPERGARIARREERARVHIRSQHILFTDLIGLVRANPDRGRGWIPSKTEGEIRALDRGEGRIRFQAVVERLPYTNSTKPVL